MKRKIGLVVLLVSMVLLSAPNSCQKCAYCTMYDNNGDYVGTSDFCGENLEIALDDPEHFNCNAI